MKAKFRTIPLAALTSLVLTGTPQIFAANGSWNYDGSAAASNKWDNAASWTGGVPDGPGETATFSFNITANRSITLNGDRTVGSLTIGDPTSKYFNYALSAGTPNTSRLIFDATGVGNALLTYGVADSTAANSISAPMLLNDNLVIASAVTAAANPSQGLSGIISDGAVGYSITKTGAGLITLSGANTYSGGARLSDGKITASNPSSFGGGGVAVSSGGQAFLSSTASAYANNFSIAGSGCTLTTPEANSANLVGAIRYANATTSGAISVNSAGARLGAIAGATGTLNGVLTGTGALEINSAATGHSGTIILTGNASTFTGTLTASAGTLKLESTSNLGGSLVIADLAKLYANNISGNAAAATIGTDGGAARSLTLGSATGTSLYLDPTATAATVNGNVTLVGDNTVYLTASHPGGAATVLNYSGSLIGSAATLELPGGIANYRAGTMFDAEPGSPKKITLALVSNELTWTGDTNANWDTSEAN